MPVLELVRDDSPEAGLGLGPSELCGFTPRELGVAPPSLVAVPELEDELDSWNTTEAGILIPTAKPQIVPARPPFRHLRRSLARYDVRLEYVEGWRTRGRPGIFEPHGVLDHHTASNKLSGPQPALGIVTFGRSDLPGPLSNFLISRRGVVHLVSQGRCNHAGYGGPIKGIPQDSGNAYLIGIECENDGIGEPWSRDLRRSLVVLNAVLLARMNERARMSIAHKEWTDRKIDPRGISMIGLRRNIRKEMRRAA